MMEDLETAITTLRDTGAGWATRKEFALRLGQLAREAIFALRDHKDDLDEDVRAAVKEALLQLPIVRATAPQPAQKNYALAELAKWCEKEGHREVTENDDGYMVEVRIDEERRQDVFIRPEEKDDGMKLVRVFTLCGKPDSSSAAWALRTNAAMVGCAFAVENHDRFEHLILVQNFECSKVSPDEILHAVRQVAYYGDWLEKCLTGEDKF